MIDFERPAALLLLAVPLWVAWVAARSAAVQREPTGTLPVWRELEESAARAQSTRRRPPFALWLLVGALCAAVLALAAPRSPSSAGAGRWRVIVDRSPSMYLALGGGTRLERALELATEQLRAGGVEWLAASDDFTALRTDGPFPTEWLAAPRGVWNEPRWELFDEPGSLWITDDAATLAPRSASLVASGGEAVPGVVYRDAATTWTWDGARLSKSATPLGRTPSCFVAPGLAGSPLERAVEAWRKARGFERGSSADTAALAVVVGGEGEPLEVDCTAGAWHAAGRARRVPPSALEPSRSVLTCGDVDVARARAGVLEVGWTSEGAPSGDGTEYALYWAAVLDQIALPREGVALDERGAAGEARVQWRSAPLAAQPEQLWPSWLASIATALAVAALALRR